MKKQPIVLLLSVLLLLVGVNYLDAWTAPTFAPTSGNIDAPVNVGSTPQIKTGGLGVTLFRASDVAVFDDTVTLGTPITAAAGLKLDVNGKVGATHYCDADGNNCVTAGSLGSAADFGTYANIGYVDNTTLTAAVNLFVTAWSPNGSGCWIEGYVGGALIDRSAVAAAGTPAISFIVPKGATWKVDFRNDPACLLANQNVRVLGLETI